MFFFFFFCCCCCFPTLEKRKKTLTPRSLSLSLSPLSTPRSPLASDDINPIQVHLTTYATGCIFHYDDAFPEGSGKGFKEDDKPNFTGSYYSFTKAMVESLLREYPNVLVLRVRMPIVGDLVYPRNFVAKILRYEKIVNIPNSMTVLPELLPMSIEMAKRGLTGEFWCLSFLFFSVLSFTPLSEQREREREGEGRREREKEKNHFFFYFFVFFFFAHARFFLPSPLKKKQKKTHQAS